MPSGAIDVGRPSKWGNPYTTGRSYDWVVGGISMKQILPVKDAEDAIEFYKKWIRHQLRCSPDLLNELRGRDLVCWCAMDQRCHADTKDKVPDVVENGSISGHVNPRGFRREGSIVRGAASDTLRL